MSRTPKGFSQIELLVAVAVLAVGILSLFAAFAYHLRVTYYAQNLAQAAALDRRLIELVRTQTDFSQPLPASLNDPKPRALNAAPFSNQEFSAEELERFQRSIEVERVDSDPTHYQYSLWRIRVGLYWRDKDAPFHVHYESYYREN